MSPGPEISVTGGVEVEEGSDVSVVDTSVSGFPIGFYAGAFSFEPPTRNVLYQNVTVSVDGNAILLGYVENATVSNSTFEEGRFSELSASGVTIVDSDMRSSTVHVSTSGFLIANNTIGRIWIDGSPAPRRPVVIRDNEINPPEQFPVSNYAVFNRYANPRLIEIHGNVLNTTGYGVRSLGEGYIDARGNYWGHPSGPSSPAEGNRTVPLADPRTGALADGEGGMVTANSSESTVSNVCFDPWKDSAETGVENGSWVGNSSCEC